MLAPSLAASLPNFIYWNVGTVNEVIKDRVCVKWDGVGQFWFDAEAIAIAA